MNLRDKAAAAAAPDDERDHGIWVETAPHTSAAALPAPAPERLDPVEAPAGQDDDPPALHTVIAIARAMRDLGIIAKADRFEGGNAGRYNFRGADRVVNACAPVLRKHGLIVVPEVRTVEYRDVPRKEGGRSHECVVTVAWHWHGPIGGPVTAVTAGEALDTSDKATAKAQTVAWRVCLIQMLAIPTGDPDPDSVLIERGEQPLPVAADYRDEIADPRTSLGRLKQIRTELATHNLGGVVVTNEVGDDEQLAAMLNRIGRERQGTS